MGLGLFIFNFIVWGLIASPHFSLGQVSDHDVEAQSQPTQHISPTLRAIRFILGPNEKAFEALLEKINQSPEPSENLIRELVSLVGNDGLNLIRATEDYSWLKSEVTKTQLANLIRQTQAPEPQAFASRELLTETPPVYSPQRSQQPVARTVTSTHVANEKYAELLRMKELLAEIPLPTKFESIKNLETNPDTVKARALMRKMAIAYTELFNFHRKTPGKDINDFPMIEDINSVLRKRGGAEKLGGVSPAEMLWEHELSVAMAESGTKIETGDILNTLVKHKNAWAETNPMGKPLPNLVDAERTVPSYQLARSSLVSLGLVSWASHKLKNGEKLSDNEKQLILSSLNSLFSHSYFSRPEVGPDSNGRIDLGQISTWGKIYSLDVINLLNSEPELLKLAPSLIKDKTKNSALIKTIQDNLFVNLTAFKSDANMENGVGGSFFHTSLTFAAFGVLRKEQIDSLYPKFRMIREAKNDGTWPYTPARSSDSGETRRSSSGRGTAVALTQLIHDPSKESAQKGVEALEQLFNYSGSLKAHVAREGVHSGEDAIAPYYWAPGLQSAGKLAKQLSEQIHLLTPDYQKRLLAAIDHLDHSAKATLEPTNNIITHPGVSTFQQLGPTFSTSLTMGALHDFSVATQNISNFEAQSQIPVFAQKLQTGFSSSGSDLEATLKQFDHLARVEKGIEAKRVQKLFQDLKVEHTTSNHTLLLTRLLSQSTHELTPKEKLFLLEAQETFGDDMISAKIREMAKLALSKRGLASD